jgi:hypothetical protein
MNIVENFTIVLDRIFKNIPLVVVFFILYKFQEIILTKITSGLQITQNILLNILLYLLLFVINLFIETFIG